MTTDSKVVAWGRSKLPQSPTGWIVLGLAAVAWIYLLVATGGDLVAGTIWSVPFLLLMAALTTRWRTLPFRHLAGLFLVGFGPIFSIALLVQWLLGLEPIDDAVRSLMETLAASGFDLQLTQPSADIWAPITEEFLKVTPVLVLMRWRATSFTTLAGPIDYAVVGGATGAGFAFAEDVLVLISPNFLTHPAAETFGFGLGRFYQSLVGADALGRHARSGYSNVMSFLFPEMQELNGATWAGHGALAFGLGLSIGIAVWMVRRGRRRSWYLLPAVAYLWVTWEHILGNWYGGAGCNRRDLPLCTLANIDLRGRVVPVVILVGVGFAAYVSRRSVKQLMSKDPKLSAGLDGGSMERYRNRGLAGWIGLARDTFEYLRLRNATAYGTEAFINRGSGRRLDALALVSVRTRALQLRARLSGAADEALPEGASQIMERAAPLH